MFTRRLFLWEVWVIHKFYSLNVVSAANTPAYVDLQQNFMISDSCFFVYAKAIYHRLFTVTVFKKESELLWARNNKWRWSSASCEIMSFVLCSNDFRIVFCRFLICFKFCGFVPLNSIVLDRQIQKAGGPIFLEKV